MKYNIQHYPRRRNYGHAATIIAMWVASAALMAFLIDQAFNLAK